MARKSTDTQSTDTPIATKDEVEGAIRDVLAGDPSAAEAIVEKATRKRSTRKAANETPEVGAIVVDGEKPKPARKPRAAKPEPGPFVELAPLVVEGLKQQGFAAEAKTSAKGNYCRVLVGGKPVGTMHFRERGAVRVRVRVAPGKLPKSIKGFEPLANVRNGLAYGGTFRDPKDVPQAVAAFKLAAETLAKAEAKAEAGKEA